MSLFILSALLSWTVISPGPSDVLQTGEMFKWAPPFVTGWSMSVVRDGVPVTVSGYRPLPGWGSFDSLTVRTPLEAGVWGGGRWETDFSSYGVPDSSFNSGIGLIENTGGGNRYSAGLRRPVTSLFKMDLSMTREDTVNNQRFVLGFGELEAGGRGWRAVEDGYALWTGWRPDEGLARITFAHFRSGGEYWEALAMWGLNAGPFSVRSAAAASLEDDSVHNVQGHLRLEMPVGGMRAVARGDMVDDDGELLFGGTAGLIAEPWVLRLQAGLTAEPGADPRVMGAVGAGPSDLFVEVWDGVCTAGLQTVLNTDYGFLHAGARAGGDTLAFNGTLMPSVRWGAAGRLYGGVSWEVTGTDTSTVGTMDAGSMFTLGRFAFIFALEDVLDDWRSYSFGITWTFSDRRETLDIDDR
ncbi:MAG: hypothetical protein JXA64_03705 [Candidatus Fermentibacteraceae bacterium]|nr:hypothetical protein [Candidatus Fermentibacteraceae bacterium]MBN2608199.1 hypothetical protein [Candidatus Fermentibacteraceae bacterium]